MQGGHDLVPVGPADLEGGAGTNHEVTAAAAGAPDVASNTAPTAVAAAAAAATACAAALPAANGSAEGEAGRVASGPSAAGSTASDVPPPRGASEAWQADGSSSSSSSSGKEPVAEARTQQRG